MMRGGSIVYINLRGVAVARPAVAVVVVAVAVAVVIVAAQRNGKDGEGGRLKKVVLFHT